MSVRTQHRLAAVLAILLILITYATVQAQEEEGDEFYKYQPYRDYGHDWRLGWMMALTPEDGLLLGSGAILYEFGFRVFPYVYRMELVGGLSIPTARFKVVYTLRMPSLSERLSLDLKSHASELEIRNFYGLQNSSVRDEQKEDKDFYRVASREYLVRPTLFYGVSGKTRLGVGALIKHFEVRQKDNRFLNTTNLTAFGDDKTIVAVGLNLVIDTRDHALAPHQGFFVAVSGWNYNEISSTGKPFQKISGDIRFYVGQESFTDIMLALRVGGERIYGPFPFYEAAFLGGISSLRGYPLQRFGGDASAFGSAELRFSIARPKLLIPTEFGMFFLADAGRVWVDGKSPGSWHGDAGVGIWLAPLSRDMLLSVSFAVSPEGLFVNG